MIQRRALYTGFLFFTFAFLWYANTYRTTFGDRFRDEFQVPALPNPGGDFMSAMDWTKQMMEGHPCSVMYPPGAASVFAPFVSVPYPLNYHILSWLLIGAIFTAVFFSLAESRVVELPLALIFAATVTTTIYNSGWFQFEMERGNSNTFISAACAGGLYALSRGRPMTAALLFAWATEMRVYPAIMIAILVLRGGIKPVLLFIATNMVGLFCAGKANFDVFIQTVTGYGSLIPPWSISHSLASAAALYGFSENRVVARNLLLFLFCVCWLGVWLASRKSPRASARRGFSVAEVGLIGLAFQLMDLLPNISWDYKLGIQIVPFMLLISRRDWVRSFSMPVWIALVGSVALSFGFFMSPGWRPKSPGHAAAVLAYAATVVAGLRLSRAARRGSVSLPAAAPSGTAPSPG